jgi:hypothetical protein
MLLSWLYGSWIYDYLCNHCILPLTLWVRIPIMARCTWYNNIWKSLFYDISIGFWNCSESVVIFCFWLISLLILKTHTKWYEQYRVYFFLGNIVLELGLSTHHNVKTYINHKTVNAVYAIFCKSYDKWNGRGRSSNTITNLVIKQQGTYLVRLLLILL